MVVIISFTFLSLQQRVSFTLFVSMSFEVTNSFLQVSKYILFFKKPKQSLTKAKLVMWLVSYSPGFKEKDSATLEESLKICIWVCFSCWRRLDGVHLWFFSVPLSKTRFFAQNYFEMALTPNQLADDYKVWGEEKNTFFLLECKISAKSVQ